MEKEPSQTEEEGEEEDMDDDFQNNTDDM